MVPVRGKTRKNSWDQLRKDFAWSPLSVWALFVGDGRFFTSRWDMTRISMDLHHYRVWL